MEPHLICCCSTLVRVGFKGFVWFGLGPHFRRFVSSLPLPFCLLFPPFSVTHGVCSSRRGRSILLSALHYGLRRLGSLVSSSLLYSPGVCGGHCIRWSAHIESMLTCLSARSRSFV